MAFDNLDLAGLANIAVRTLQHEIRQATTSAISSATSSPDPTLASTGLPSTTTPFDAPTSTAPADNGANNGNSGNGNGNGGSGQGSSPLLFFVALGFGVVFTNLWIIVGVKYCFRYNARNRNIRMTGEDGEPINLENMPQHPRRRRREKKLMTMDEVNEKFPMMKYKNWVASRAQEGLPTRGGISQPPSRANSIRDADGIIPTIKERESTEDRPATSGTSIVRETTREPTTEHAEKATPTATADGEAPSTNPGTTNATTAPARTDSPASDDDHYEEDDQIHDALPPEALESSGDTCAICIDTLEDDDDVRGLTCGHAFHAVCLDPWLTSRRACCPLCKADYYTPKPRQPQPEGTEGTQVGPTVSIAQDPRTARANMPSRPGVAWIFSGRRGRMGLPGRNRDNGSNQPQSQSRSNTNGRRHRQQQQQQPQQQRTGFFSRSNTQPSSRPAPAAADNTTTPQTTEARSGGFLSNIRSQLPSFGRSNAQEQSAANAQVTPSALEAGTRADAAR